MSNSWTTSVVTSLQRRTIWYIPTGLLIIALVLVLHFVAYPESNISFFSKGGVFNPDNTEVSAGKPVASDFRGYIKPYEEPGYLSSGELSRSKWSFKLECNLTPKSKPKGVSVLLYFLSDTPDSENSWTQSPYCLYVEWANGKPSLKYSKDGKPCPQKLQEINPKNFVLKVNCTGKDISVVLDGKEVGKITARKVKYVTIGGEKTSSGGKNSPCDIPFYFESS